jgi:GT2 family glycosyltransferase
MFIEETAYKLNRFVNITKKIIFFIILDPKKFLLRMKDFYNYAKTGDFKIIKNKLIIFLAKDLDLKKFDIRTYNIKNQHQHQHNGRAQLSFPVFKSPLVSIIIPVYDKLDYTLSCLNSVMENTKGQSYEVIIADDGSTDETKNIENFVKNIKVIRNTKNLGFLKNCNNASKFAKGQYILLLNNDANVQPDYLKYLLELFEGDEKIGMAGSKIIYPNGILQEAGGILWKDGSAENYGKGGAPEEAQYNYVKEVDYISGCSLIIKKKLWEEIGGFDERFAPSYYEDTDLAFEARKRGYKVVYQPRSAVVHFEKISHGDNITHMLVNKPVFYKKWSEILEKEHFSWGENIFLARDRSYGKKTILVIDHDIPAPDKDAGSKTVFQYLELFCGLGLNVKFIPNKFFYEEKYAKKLEDMGIETLCGKDNYKNRKRWIKTNAEYLDFVMLNRPDTAAEYIDFIKKYTKAAVLYCGHDLHYLRELRRYEIEKDPQALKESEKWKKIEFDMFKKSDAVLTFSADEKKIIDDNSSGAKTKNIPLFFYDNFNAAVEDFTQKKDILFVGGFNHPPNVDGILWFLRDVFPLILKNIGDAKIIICGSSPPDILKNTDNGHNIIVKGFVSEEELKKLYGGARIGIIPLRYGAGVKGKAVELMYYGIPLVSTSIGIEGMQGIREIIEPADGAKQFALEIIKLYNNEEILKSMSEKETAYIKKHFSKETAKNIFSGILGL